MFMPLSFLCSVTQLIAAITCEISTAPSAAPALTLIIRASGAMPTNLEVSLKADFFDPGATSDPAMMLAMMVP